MSYQTGPDALRGLVIELGSHSNSQMVIGAVLADMGAMADAWAADRAERDAALARGDTYRRRALALTRLCRRLEEGERILGTAVAFGSARRWVVEHMAARCADCGQMVMLTIQEYIRRRNGAQP